MVMPWTKYQTIYRYWWRAWSLGQIFGPRMFWWFMDYDQDRRMVIVSLGWHVGVTINLNRKPKLLKRS